MTDHPITPPPELVEQWRSEPEYGTPGRVTLHTISEQRLFQLLTRSAQWGYEQRGEANEARLQKARDQELEACCEVVSHWHGDWVNGINLAIMLRTARRPKPPSLAEQGLEALRSTPCTEQCHYDALLAALNRLKQLEDSND